MLRSELATIEELRTLEPDSKCTLSLRERTLRTPLLTPLTLLRPCTPCTGPLLSSVLVMHDLGEDLPELLTRLDQLGRVDPMRARYYDDLRTRGQPLIFALFHGLTRMHATSPGSRYVLELASSLLLKPTGVIEAGLRAVSLRSLRLTCLPVLGPFALVHTLDLAHNRLTSLAAIGDLPSLADLDASDNAITDLADLPPTGLPALAVLNLANNRTCLARRLRRPRWLAERAAVEGLTHWAGALCPRPGLAHVDALARLGACAALRALDLSGNAVADHGDALRAALPQVEHWDNK